MMKAVYLGDNVLDIDDRFEMMLIDSEPPPTVIHGFCHQHLQNFKFKILSSKTSNNFNLQSTRNYYNAVVANIVVAFAG